MKPTGKVSADRLKYAPGDAVTMKVKLDQPSTIFPANIGFYNVGRVVAVRKDGRFSTEVLADQKPAPGQTEFTLTFSSPTSLDADEMFIGTLSGIHYARFAALLIVPALLSLASVLVVLRVFFRSVLQPRGAIAVHLEPPRLDRKGAVVCLAALALVVSGFLLGFSLAWTAMTGAALLLIALHEPPRLIFAGVDGVLLLFFAALFVVTHGVAHTGIAERLYRGIEPLLGTTPMQQTLAFGGFTVVASQLVSNVPFVMLAGHWIPKLADPDLGWLSLALVGTLAGNLTPVASVANLIVLELAGDRGKIPFLRFLAVGAACTFVPMVLALAWLLAEHSLGLFR